MSSLLPTARGAFLVTTGAALSLVVATTLAMAAPAHAKPSPDLATYLIQGVPGIDVDVSIDGDVVQSGVPAKEVVGPVDLDPGRHTVEFASSEWTATSSFAAGEASQDVVLHWPADAADKPTVTVFTNDLKPVAADEARLTVAHTAVVPPADILASGEVLFSNIANGEFVTAEVPADSYSVAVVPTGGGDPLLGPVDLPVEAGSLTRVFAIGAPREGSMDAVVQVIPLEERSVSAPTSVDTGSAGLVAPGAPTARPGDEQPVGAAQALALVALLVALAGTVGLRLRRANS